MSAQYILALVLFAVTLLYILGNRRDRQKARIRSMDFPGFSQLEPLEKRLLIELFALRYSVLWMDSTWQIAIQNVCTTGYTSDFRKLCVQLWDQAQDAPEVMVSIIGAEAYDLLRQRMQSSIVRHMADHFNDSGVHTDAEWYESNLGYEL